MNQLKLTLFLVTLLTTVFGANVDPIIKNIDVEGSTMTWKGYKVLGAHNGSIALSSGRLEFNGDILIGGEVIVNMESINCLDLSGGGKSKLEGHLKSDDFFGVNTYPTSTIKIVKVVSKGKSGEYKITANLTIKNTTKEIKFDAKVSGGTASTTLKIDRSDFDIKYGSGSFFENLGDKTIYDEFDLEINIKF